MYRRARFVLTSVVLSAVVGFAADVIVFGPGDVHPWNGRPATRRCSTTIRRTA